MTDYRLDGQGSIPSKCKGFFITTMFRLVLQTTKLLIQWTVVTISPEV
jgi:hypothetical protein